MQRGTVIILHDSVDRYDGKKCGKIFELVGSIRLPLFNIEVGNVGNFLN